MLKSTDWGEDTQREEGLWEQICVSLMHFPDVRSVWHCKRGQPLGSAFQRGIWSSSERPENVTKDSRKKNKLQNSGRAKRQSHCSLSTLSAGWMLMLISNRFGVYQWAPLTTANLPVCCLPPFQWWIYSHSEMRLQMIYKQQIKYYEQPVVLQEIPFFNSQAMSS